MIAVQEKVSIDASAMPTLAVEVDQVTKQFSAGSRGWPWQQREGDAKREAKGPVVAIDDVSLTIRKNEIYGVLGSNGSGKSTLIRLISTLLIPDRGHVRVFGRDVVREEARVKRLINRVSVEASFFKKLSPLENLSYAIRLYGMDGTASRGAIVKTLAELGIDEARLTRPLEEMSRGMQQKVAIARVLDVADTAPARRADHWLGPTLQARRAGFCEPPARRARRDDPLDDA